MCTPAQSRLELRLQCFLEAQHQESPTEVETLQNCPTVSLPTPPPLAGCPPPFSLSLCGAHSYTCMATACLGLSTRDEPRGDRCNVQEAAVVRQNRGDANAACRARCLPHPELIKDRFPRHLAWCSWPAGPTGEHPALPTTTGRSAWIPSYHHQWHEPEHTHPKEDRRARK